MVLLAFTDMTATACSCSITGPLLIIGSVFCVYPTFTYIAAYVLVYMQFYRRMNYASAPPDLHRSNSNIFHDSSSGTAPHDDDGDI
ncbi:hypothetical protein GCK72_012826 [Caenorhabditis remanei]|uniref:Uncharacterized protein n=1 Tax=Caenorhabditis remanei TaxID=31234 RepID=A0A6A5GP75_CAERE|nr:hypothetical protein GCK72_012826 [Caenorhabditis remanei]KAF1756373.1 hypothetical protein GCK72_012826 [Caenorhabditis remanei]